MAGRLCPTPGCGRTAAAGQLLCPMHWRRVPADLKAEVWRTWKAWRSDFGDADKMHTYRAAADAATQASAR